MAPEVGEPECPPSAVEAPQPQAPGLPSTGPPVQPSADFAFRVLVPGLARPGQVFVKGPIQPRSQSGTEKCTAHAAQVERLAKDFSNCEQRGQPIRPAMVASLRSILTRVDPADVYKDFVQGGCHFLLRRVAGSGLTSCTRAATEALQRASSQTSLRLHFRALACEWLAAVLLEQGEPERASRAAEAAVRHEATPERHLSLGLCYMALAIREGRVSGDAVRVRRLHGAQASLERAIKLDRECAHAYRELNFVLESLGDLERARQTARRCVETGTFWEQELQRPYHFVRGLSTQPWHQPDAFEVCAQLEPHLAGAREEVGAVLADPECADMWSQANSCVAGNPEHSCQEVCLFNRQRGDKAAITAPRVRFGITHRPTEEPGGVRFESVLEGGAAEEAGLLEGDVLVRWNGAEVENGSAWVEMMATHEPGDEVSVVVTRDGESVEAVVRLKACEPQELDAAEIAASRCERTLGCLQELPSVASARLLRLSPGACTETRCGMTNTQLVCIAGMTGADMSLDGCLVHVATEEPWVAAPGAGLLVCDHSFEHHFSNPTEEHCVLLAVNFWHPEVPSNEWDEILRFFDGD